MILKILKITIRTLVLNIWSVYKQCSLHDKQGIWFFTLDILIWSQSLEGKPKYKTVLAGCAVSVQSLGRALSDLAFRVPQTIT